MIVNLPARIADVIEIRRAMLPRIRDRIARAAALDRDLALLMDALLGLAEHPQATRELKAAVDEFRAAPLRAVIADNLGDLRMLEARTGRATINIGVSGQARVGKSTLLQTISGLSEEQVPTGSGIPVTAVRSRIRHSSSRSRATLTLHGFESFRDEVLRPYHQELAAVLATHPATLAEFRRFDYSVPPDKEAGLKPSQKTLLQRLRAMRRALPSYEAHLTGGEKVVPLTELRQWVAYPPGGKEDDPDCPRPYLAVRDVLIECPFPENDVEALEFVDLPGLGELNAGAEKRHVEDLRNDARSWADRQIAAETDPVEQAALQKRYRDTGHLLAEHEMLLGFNVYLLGTTLKLQVDGGGRIHERSDEDRQDGLVRTQIQLAF